MTFKIIFISILVSFHLAVYSQVCIHKDLSKQFDFKISVTRVKQYKSDDSCSIILNIIDKVNGGNIQTIKHTAILPSNKFADCIAVRSYQTNKNGTVVVKDNNYGDFIIADFNFDGQDDFAILKDFGGNGGPLYDYYIQEPTKKFNLDRFLSDSMIFFPVEINKKSKTLMTLVHANVLEQSETIYKFNESTKQWGKISDRLLPYK